MASWAERYEAGECEAVWAELVDLGLEVYEPRWRADADRVVDLTMDRATANVATLVVRLSLMGYRFGHRYDRNVRRRTIEDLGLRESMARAGRDVTWVDAGEIEEHVMGWEAPAASIESEIAAVERLTGELPLSLRSFIARIDRVDLSGSFPEWDPGAYAFDDPDWPSVGLASDALSFNGVETIAEFARTDSDLVDPTRLPAVRSVAVPIAANHLLKANQIGAFHTVALPDRTADPVVDGVFRRPGIRFVEYLRETFAWGGFPGFAFAASVPPQIDILRRDLLPI